MVASVKFPSVRTAYCTSAIKYPVRQFDNSTPKSTINPVLLTSVLLLANSAHQSALNLRKDLIGHHELSVEDDFRFFDRIMTIKQCAKSSILWHHRRWLFARLYLPVPAMERTFLDDKLEIRQLRKAPFTDDDMCSLRLSPSVITRELELITKACEVYPRNYHAWYHRHLIISSCITQARVLLQEQPQQSDSTSRSSLRAVSQSELNSFLSKNSFLAVLLHELESMKLYIDRHVSDCTAMGYLCDLRRDCLDLIKLEETNDILQHAQELLRTYPERESTWLYLRRTYSSFSRDEDLRSLTEQVLKSLRSTHGKERRIEQGLRTIIFTYVKVPYLPHFVLFIYSYFGIFSGWKYHGTSANSSSPQCW